jgi:hypothetical protein
MCCILTTYSLNAFEKYDVTVYLPKFYLTEDSIFDAELIYMSSCQEKTILDTKFPLLKFDGTYYRIEFINSFKKNDEINYYSLINSNSVYNTYFIGYQDEIYQIEVVMNKIYDFEY